MQHGCHFEAGCSLQAMLRQRGNGEFGEQRDGRFCMENRFNIDVRAEKKKDRSGKIDDRLIIGIRYPCIFGFGKFCQNGRADNVYVTL